MIGHQGGKGPPNRRGCWGGGMYETDGNISVCTVQVDFELFGEFEQAEPLTSYSPPRMVSMRICMSCLDGLACVMLE